MKSSHIVTLEENLFPNFVRMCIAQNINWRTVLEKLLKDYLKDESKKEAPKRNKKVSQDTEKQLDLDQQ